MIDATRNTLTVDELCAPLGFQVFFKISSDDAEAFGNDVRIIDPLPDTEDGEKENDDDDGDEKEDGDDDDDEKEDGDDDDDEKEEDDDKDEHSPDYKLIHYGTCYFDENLDFRMQTLHDEEDGMYEDMEWGWLKTGLMIRVGNFPPLHVTRRRDWSWQLENMNVLLYPRGIIEF
jgi:hypothetical protein